MLARAHRNRLLATGGSTGTRTRTWHLKRVLRCRYAILPLKFHLRRPPQSLRAPAVGARLPELRRRDHRIARDGWFSFHVDCSPFELRDSGKPVESLLIDGAAGRDRTCDACAFNAALYQAELQRQNWSGVRDSNSSGQLGRLEHFLYANAAKVVGRVGFEPNLAALKTRRALARQSHLAGSQVPPSNVSRSAATQRAVTSPEVERSISIAKPASCRSPAKRPTAFRFGDRGRQS